MEETGLACETVPPICRKEHINQTAWGRTVAGIVVKHEEDRQTNGSKSSINSIGLGWSEFLVCTTAAVYLSGDFPEEELADRRGRGQLGSRW